MASAKKVQANRDNGKRSNGPLDTSRTRFNALKHGFLAKARTRFDDDEAIELSLAALNGNGIEARKTFLRECIAVNMVRLRRLSAVEAQYMKPSMFDMPGSPNSEVQLDNIVKLLRCEVALQNMLFRCMHELERLERLDQGEDIPAPTVHDVTFHDATTNIEPPATERLQTPHHQETSPVATPKTQVSDSVTPIMSNRCSNETGPQGSPHAHDSSPEGASTSATVFHDEQDSVSDGNQSPISESIGEEPTEDSKDTGT